MGVFGPDGTRSEILHEHLGHGTCRCRVFRYRVFRYRVFRYRVFGWRVLRCRVHASARACYSAER
jgi:hypothetical protein